MNLYFYTVIWEGIKYRAICPYYGLKKAAKYLGVSVDNIYSGADSNLPLWIVGNVE